MLYRSKEKRDHDEERNRGGNCPSDEIKKIDIFSNMICPYQENDDILNVVAEEWKRLSDKDRAHWDEESRNDKVR